MSKWWILVLSLTVLSLGCFHLLFSYDVFHGLNNHKLEVNSPGHKTCQPVKNIYFLRIPKTGSSTLANILCRYALKHHLNISTGYGSPLQRENQSSVNAIIYQHTEFNETAIRQIMAPHTALITLIREPLAHLKSIFNYMHLDQQFHLENMQDPFDVFLHSPGQFDTDPAPLTRNMLSRPFGMEAKAIDEEHKLINLVLSKFSSVLMNEYFEESLLLLMNKLCMNFSDLLFLSLKTMSYKQKTKTYSTRLRANHKHWSHSDYALYSYFKRHIHEQITTEENVLKPKVQKLKTMNKLIEAVYQKVCILWVELVHRQISDVEAEHFLMKAIGIGMNQGSLMQFVPLDCLQYTVDERIMMRVIQAQQTSSLPTVNINDLILAEICKINKFCKQEVPLQPSFLRHFLRLAREHGFTFPIQWCQHNFTSS